MTSILWRGNWITRTRILSGLVLFTYAFFHFVNIGLGLLSPDWMHAMQDGRQWVTRSLPGGLVLYGAFLVHIGLALYSLARRRTLRMTAAEALQVGLGLLIPLQLTAHVIYTRCSHAVHDVNDRFSYIIVLMWNSPEIWQQSALLLVVWIHGCIGLHFWLRLTRWWSGALPYMIGLAVLVPGFALAGLLVEGRRVSALFQDANVRQELMRMFRWPSNDTFASLALTEQRGLGLFLALLVATATIHVGRRLWVRRHSVKIRYIDGPEVTSARGLTLLEISKTHGIPHTALCGGKGRCTTCRVLVEEGADLLHPPDETEQRSLKAVGAPPNMRLACQIRPTDSATVFRVFRPQGGRNRAHASQGEERQLAILFLDMRSFTARTTGQLPYDVVFLLNRFFDAIVPAITEQGGVVDKYLGDGLLAVFETRDSESSARAGLRAASGVGRALERFNQMLVAEKDAPVTIGMGLHLGNLVLGEIGAAGHAPRTIIGDTVNAASRLEAETKALGVEVIVSASVLDAAGIDRRLLTMRRFELRGLAQPVEAAAFPRATELGTILGS